MTVISERHLRSALSAMMAAALVACGDDSAGPDQPTGPLDVTINFAALVNGAPFACGQSYDNVGTTQTTITPVDYRFYVHDVALVSSAGVETPLELDETPIWQDGDLVLLDFENGSGPCVNGTADTNTSVVGTVPAGDYDGLRFTLGVPFDMNHQDHSVAEAPLDLSSLFWAWNAGYKFLRIDHVSAEQPNGWFVHLGSTGCTPAGDPTVPATTCANEHRVDVSLATFDWQSNEVVADIGQVLAGSDLSQNLGGAKGCQSFPNDPECPMVMNNLGLDYEGSVSSGQVLFSVR